MDAALFDASPDAYTSLVSVEVVSVEVLAPPPADAQRAHRRERKKRSAKPKLDRRRKTFSKGITSLERRDLRRADGFAAVIRKPLRTTLDFHPVHLDTYPAGELDQLFRDVRTRISTWCARQGVGSYWVWTRENYEGEGREHLHMVMHLPPRLRRDLEDHLRNLYSGDVDLVRVGERTTHRCPETGRRIDGLDYRMKQLRGDAVGPPGPTRLYRETKSRHDGAPVAPVYGKRCGVSDSLTLKAEEKWRAERS